MSSGHAMDPGGKYRLNPISCSIRPFPVCAEKPECSRGHTCSSTLDGPSATLGQGVGREEYTASFCLLERSSEPTELF